MRNRKGMARYGIVAAKVFGVSVVQIRELAKRYGRDHALAEALWRTGWHEARMLAAFVDDPMRVSPAQMDRWARQFDNWAICDTTCSHLFDKSPHAWRKIAPWARRRDEFVRRAAFALLASLGVHDKTAPDRAFTRLLPLIERAAADERNFVKKAVSWALRVVGRRSAALNAASIELARRLIGSGVPPARWVGRDALRELTSPRVARSLETRAARTGDAPDRGASRPSRLLRGAAERRRRGRKGLR
jgi:3-methyladenine DNA glycosylase AlkD